MPLLALLGVIVAAHAQTASVSGRVTDRATGQPVARMVVAVVGTDRKTAGEALTDADGRYEIAGLQPGEYAVGVSHDEHRSTYLRQWFDESAPSPVVGVPPRFALALKAGDRRTDVDVALTRALAIEGAVLNPSGEPVTEVEVSLAAFGNGALSRVGPPIYTDDHGTYRIYGLMPGRYRVCARPSGDWFTGDLSGVVRTCHPSTASESDASDVLLTSQDATGVDIRLQRLGIRSVSGTVVDASGAPADRTAVSVTPVEESGRGGGARTENGAFTVKGLAPGRYVISASIGGSHRGDVDPPARERETAYAPLDLGAVDATVTLAMSKAVTVAGTVTFEGGAAPAGRPRLTVDTFPAGDLRTWISEQQASAAVRDDFTFELGDVFRLPLRISVRGLPEGWALKSVRFGDRDITYGGMDLTAAPGARLLLVVTNRVASPLVKVVNDRGEDIPASHAVAIPADPERWTREFLRYPMQPATGAVSKLGSLLPGDYYFTALSIEDFVVLMRDPSRIVSIAAIATKVTLEPGDTRLFTLRLVPLPGR